MTFPASFHPLVRAWFERSFEGPTTAQSRGWPEIAAGRDTLVSAATGSGKTLAAFLYAIDRLVRDAASPAGLPERGISVVYVSPLKALSTDVHRNLEAPLDGVRAVAAESGVALGEIRTALRTGDTSAARRGAILRRPPHVLVTTPESLYLMLTAERTRALLAHAQTVIVDEVHALMRDKRGSHLALSLARLDAVAEHRPQRIGLSATVHPLEAAARFLVGVGRPCAVVDVGHRRDLDVAVEVPATDLGAVPTHEQWAEVYDRVAALIREHRTTLVFVNTRQMAERVARHLGERLGPERVAAHHGSLAKDRRLALEQRLKAGDMKAIVATASLELGIDVGSVDLVCQIGSPRSITTFLQRIGRSGHALGRTSRGRLFATSRDELVECAALVRAVAAGRLDAIAAPRCPLDVLAQQIAAECAARDWPEDALYEAFRRAAPFEALSREDFDAVVAFLADGPASRLGRAGALLHRDGVHGVLRARRGTRIHALTNGGAIPDVADYRVVADPDETFVGTVNEDWAIESHAGDVFALGSHSWRIRRVESRTGVLRVEDAQGQPPSVPFWLGEAPGRSWELSGEVSRLRSDIDASLAAGEAGRAGVARWLATECGLNAAACEQIAAYVGAQRNALGVVPTIDDVVFERFFDEAGGMQLVVHAPFGARVNRAFGLALRKRFCQSFDFELQAAATDDAVVLSTGTTNSFPLTDAFRFVRADRLRPTLEQAVLAAPMFGTRFRWNASRALAVARFAHGKRVMPYLQRLRADDLLAAVFPALVACQENATGPREVPDHVLVRQTIDDCLHEAMDFAQLRSLLELMEAGAVRLHARDTTEPSPFAHEILNAKPYAFLDDAPLEERRTRAVALRRTLPDHQRDLGALDPSAIERVVADARHEPRDADELHDVLLGLGVAVVDERSSDLLRDLVRAGRAAVVATAAGPLAFAAENAQSVAALYPGAPVAPPVAADPVVAGRFRSGRGASRESVIVDVVRGHAEVAGPFTAAALARGLALEAWEVQAAAGVLESQGLLLRGRFRQGAEGDELCDRRLLARIHRMTLDRLRSEIAPVSAQDFMRYLLDRHRLSSSARGGGRAGLRDAIEILQGFEIAASAWERGVLAPRVAGYRGEWLDELCLAGEVSWARLSLRSPAAAASGAGTPTTSRATPIALAFRHDLAWLREAVRGAESPEPPAPGPASTVLAALERRGALFFEDVCAATQLSGGDVAEALLELVGRGLVAGDGFSPLRELLVGRREGPRPRRRFAGRWSILGRLDDGGPHDDLADRVAGQLLTRYGVVFRELGTREAFTVPWRLVARALRRREARGEVRGGRFVAGFTGEQFALAEAVDGLRRVRRTERAGEAIRVRAADPCNLVGVLTPGPRIPRAHARWLVFRDGKYEGTEEARRAVEGAQGGHLSART
jgi:ATP-dependent Lhr-like helicase